jgi:DNA primase
MALTKDIIQTIKDRADIVQIVGEKVRLIPAGHQFKGLCPFHAEKTPSFTVNPQRGFYHCFGCGAGGSAIDFVMAYERLPFAEAATLMAERLGIALPKSGAAPGAARSLEALEAARLFYRHNLVQRPEGEAARRYLLERNFGEEMWEAFSLGYALEQWQGWTDTASKQGFKSDDLIAAGLARTGKTGRPYDLLRDRIVFPIRDERGRVIAFGGRVIRADDEPKYLNTPETRHYHKSRVLFGLSQGAEAIRKRKRAILVEGYLDVLRLHERGFQEAVATCGTALTAEHLELLGRHTNKVLLVFDGDEAGMRAALRGAGLFLNGGIEARAVTLPDQLDPDDFLVRHGADAFTKHLERATPILEYLVQQTLAKHGGSIEGRQRALSELAPLIGQIGKESARDLTVRHLADLAGVRPEAILALVPRQQPGRAGPAESVAEANRAAAQSTAGLAPRESRHERMLLHVLLTERKLLASARRLIQPEEFGDADLAALFADLARLADEEFVRATWDVLIERLPGHGPLLRALAVVSAPQVARAEEWERMLRGEVARIKESRKLRLLQSLKHAAGTAEEPAALQALMTFRQELKTWKPGRQSYNTFDKAEA